mgnify:CR=1 FL=1
MKKILLVLLVSIIGFNCLSVSAKENEYYYTNEQGVNLTQEEYEFLTKMYWDDYPKIMTQQDYENFKDLNILGQDITVKVIDESDKSNTRSSFHETGSKRLKIATTCSSNCYHSVTLTWKTNPTIRSYDVIGAYFNGVSLTNNPTTQVIANNSTTFATNLKRATNGIGTSFKLPSGSNIIINQTFSTTKGGTVYASYQHATSNTTLSTSQNYTFSTLGYGRVFLFSGSARNIYDAMNGVDITI